MFKATAIYAAAASTLIALPASAAGVFGAGAEFTAPGEETYEHSRGHGRERYSRDDYRRGYRNGYHEARYDGRGYRGEPIRRDTRVWRGDNGRYYCRKENGTTGLLIGGAAGALLGREVDKYGDRTMGTVIGGVAGALLGREVDRGGSSCR